MAETTVRIDGWPVAVGTALAFANLKRAFDATFPGITLHVYSGYRSYDDQAKIFLDRYVPQTTGTGPYGDVRWWNGVRYVRTSGEGTVAQPGTSNHGNGRALDIRDSGSDDGVTKAGNDRSSWIRANAARYDFDPAGYGFGEPWHIELAAHLDPWAGGSDEAPASTPSTGGSPVIDLSEEDDMATGNHRFYRHNSDGRVFIIAGGRSIDLNEKDARKLIDIQRLNHKKNPDHYLPATSFGDKDMYFGLDQEGWNVLRAVYPPRG